MMCTKLLRLPPNNKSSSSTSALPQLAGDHEVVYEPSAFSVKPLRPHSPPTGPVAHRSVTTTEEDDVEEEGVVKRPGSCLDVMVFA